jgi:hypothetical protein
MLDKSESTTRLLKVMIGLLVRQNVTDPPTLREQIETLSNLGMRPSEIADALGRSNTYVNKELSGIRKGRKTK